jgi:hypothetical protein
MVRRSRIVASILGGLAFGTVGLVGCSDATPNDGSVGQVRSALDFGKLPDLAAGQMAIEQRATGLYQDLPVDVQPLVVRLDNPLIAWHDKLAVQSSPVGDLPEEHFVVGTSPLSILTTYGDLALTARAGDGPYADGQLIGAVNDFRMLSYARYDGGASWTKAGTFVTRGARIGYTPLEIHGAMYDRRDANQRRTMSKFVKLDPRVYLVPVEVWVTASDNYPANDQRVDYQAVLWDQVQKVKTASFSEPNVGTVKTTHTEGETAEGARIDTWIEPTLEPATKEPVYGVRSGLFTPDSIYASCGVQFRLVQFRVVKVPDRVAFPIRHTTEGKPEDDQHYESTALNDRPCRDRADAVLNHPDHRPGRVVITFTERPEFPTSSAFERVVSVGGEKVVCGTMKTPIGITGTVLAHEIGHVAGLPDCEASDRCRLMVSKGGGFPPPTASECGEIRRWARSKADHSWQLSGTQLEPAPAGDWSWPD